MLVQQFNSKITMKIGENKLGYNKLGYNKLPVITNILFPLFWSQIHV